MTSVSPPFRGSLYRTCDAGSRPFDKLSAGSVQAQCKLWAALRRASAVSARTCSNVTLVLPPGTLGALTYWCGLATVNTVSCFFSYLPQGVDASYVPG